MELIRKAIIYLAWQLFSSVLMIQYFKCSLRGEIHAKTQMGVD